ncbi:MAG: hypothetical protein RTU30_13410 [Candidatus Thorarchaeota archaeon]
MKKRTRSEAQSGTRSDTSMISDKARDLPPGLHPVLAGDSHHEKGGTQELQAEGEVHSPIHRRTRTA